MVYVDAHRKASAKNSSKLNKFLHSEVNLLIQHIVVQDEDGQNNNILVYCRIDDISLGRVLSQL